MKYEFKWKPEILFALITFIVYFLTEFIATENQEVTDWQGWLIGTAIASARVAAAVVLPVLVRWSVSLRSAGSSLLGSVLHLH